MAQTNYTILFAVEKLVCHTIIRIFVKIMCLSFCFDIMISRKYKLHLNERWFQ